MAVTYADGFLTRMDLHYPDSAAVAPPVSGWPCLLVVHGSGGNRNNVAAIALGYTKRGYVTVAVGLSGERGHHLVLSA